MIINMIGAGSGVEVGLPEFTYTGTYDMIDDGDDNWRIRLLTSGMLTFSKLGTGEGNIDVFCVGGGGSGYCAPVNRAAGGGGGGYTNTSTRTVQKDTGYEIIIGAGGAKPSGEWGVNAGGNTSAFGVTAKGGSGGGVSSVEGSSDLPYAGSGGAGGSGGGRGQNGDPSDAGGTNGGNGGGGDNQSRGWGGRGQKAVAGPNGESGNTFEFGEEDLEHPELAYSPGGGGGGGRAAGARGRGRTGVNSGAGGCGYRRTSDSSNAAGMSGIVVIRNHREVAAG